MQKKLTMCKVIGPACERSLIIGNCIGKSDALARNSVLYVLFLPRHSALMANDDRDAQSPRHPPTRMEVSSLDEGRAALLHFLTGEFS
jgi:hypothetical protein